MPSPNSASSDTSSARCDNESFEDSLTRVWRQGSPFGEITVVVSARGVAEVALPGDDQPDVPLSRPDTQVARQFDEWFAGTRHEFDLVLDLAGIDGFRRTVLETLAAKVPWGETVTYGELAELAGRPRAARAVGSAMRNNPLPFVVPCHRVVAAGNKIGGYGGGRNAIALKRALLAREGVTTLR
jgi:methylated-DNA-[protein]-cysteine S-methyltransferase